MKRRTAVTTAVVVLSVSPGAFAQQAKGFTLDNFDPSERGSDWFAADSLRMNANGSALPAIGIVADYAHQPLVIKNSDGSIDADVVSDQLVLHPGASIVLADRVRLAFDLPIAVYTNGDTAATQRIALTAPDSAAVGDLRFGGDVRLFGEHGSPAVLALGVQVYFPTGATAGYVSDGTVRVQPHVLFAGQAGIFVYAAKLGIEYRPDDDSFAQSKLGSSLPFSAAAGFTTDDGTFTIGPEVYGSTVFSSGNVFQAATTPVEGILGAHYSVAGLKFGLGGGTGFTPGLGSPAARGLLSVEWAPLPSPPDGDKDGIADKDDACPSVPGVKTDDPKTNGCPPDRDGDGVVDATDACPDVAGVHSADPSKDGCPPDRDGDGVLDDVDACPDTAGVKTDDPKTNGCPPDGDKDGIADKDDACPSVPGVKTDDPKTNGCPPDGDKDGIADKDDACPSVPGVKTDDPKTNGCPPNPDRDADGIPNELDACPDAAGKPNKDPKKNGCPLAYVQGDQIRITEQVKFRTASSTLDPTGDAVLLAVVAILKEHAEVRHVFVEGHTDNAGAAAMNQKLSEARAATVTGWLIAHGIDKSRLSSAGYGASRPLVSNDDDEGRRQNRRVEFRIETDTAEPPASK